MTRKNIAIVGAGPVGSLLAIYLAKRGYKVTMYERRADMRVGEGERGRSINLALSNRGIRALTEVGLGEKLRQVAIPMHGRMVHDLQGNTTFQPYGREGQYINSISRSELNVVLMNEAEALGIEIRFNHRVTHVDMALTALTVSTVENHLNTYHYDVIIGADGAFSAVRLAMQFTERFDLSQDYIEHGYKELHIPAAPHGGFAMERNALHIWPRESFMLIALPNNDGSFTCTLFFPFEGEPSFASLASDDAIRKFFHETFPDAAARMPSLLETFRQHPTGSLVTMKCFPWVRNKTLLIGDAAHAVVPFYGQGMNAGFEDCRILNALLDTHGDQWDNVLPAFQQLRKPDADAIAQLALENFIEMRDLVADASFVLRKKIEARLHERYPQQWIPQYSMVTFYDDIRYGEALAIGRQQRAIMDEVMRIPNIEATWQTLNFEQLVRRISRP